MMCLPAIITVRRNRRWSRQQVVGAASAIWLAASIASISVAQVPNGERATLHSQGYSDADIKATDVLQVAPHFAFYHDWKSCWDQVALQSLSSGRQVRDIRDAARTLCSDDFGYLRASLAKDLGLPRANRILGVAEAALIISYNGLYARLHPPLAAGSSNVAGWDVVHPRPTRCAASKSFQDLISPTGVILVVDQGTAELDLMVLGERGRELAKSSGDQEVSMKVTRWDQGLNATRLGSLTFRVVKDPEGAIFRIVPDQQLMESIAGADAVTLQDVAQTQPYSFHLSGIEQAWTAVQRCALAK